MMSDFFEKTYIEDAGTDWESEERVLVLAIPSSFDGAGYYLVNPHEGEHGRFEVSGDSEEIDALIAALGWIKAHWESHEEFRGKPRRDKLGDYVEVTRPGGPEPIAADDPNPVEEEG